MKINGQCINHSGCEVDGYGAKKYKGKTVRAHRLAYCLHHGINLSDIKNLVIMHLCDNRLCVNPKHLKAGTHQDNCTDKVKKGRQAKGSSIGNSKLTEPNVVDIKKRLIKGDTYSSIAANYNVSIMCISRIANNKTWRHIHV